MFECRATVRNVLTMTAVFREAPPDHRGGHELQCEDIGVTATSYDDAIGKVHARLPEGWRVLYVRVDRD